MVVITGAIRRAKLQKIVTTNIPSPNIFAGHMPFLSPNSVGALKEKVSLHRLAHLTLTWGSVLTTKGSWLLRRGLPSSPMTPVPQIIIPDNNEQKWITLKFHWYCYKIVHNWQEWIWTKKIVSAILRIQSVLEMSENVSVKRLIYSAISFCILMLLVLCYAVGCDCHGDSLVSLFCHIFHRERKCTRYSDDYHPIPKPWLCHTGSDIIIIIRQFIPHKFAKAANAHLVQTRYQV